MKKYKLTGAGFYDAPVWSPDSQKIAYADNSWSLYWIDRKTGICKKIASEYLYGPSRIRSVYSSWSPDSKWIVYTLNTQTYIQKVFVYSLDKDRSFPITDGLSEVSEPVFDPSGKYLYFFSSTDAGPVKQWFDMSNADMAVTSSLYLAVLRKDLPKPLAKESDEEKGMSEEKPKEEKGAPPEKETKPEKAAPKKEEAVAIDFEGINQRILALPISAGNYRNLQVGESGQIYYLEYPPRSVSIFDGGLNWNPELRSPLTEPGVDVRAGEYLLAVNGVDLRPPTNLFSAFENTAEKMIEITVGPNPDGTSSRTVQVVPIADESSLRNRDWVEGNLRKVEEATGGRVAYVYVPNTSTLGHTYFKRYFFPQAHEEAIIVDERHNGGGQVADYYIDLLRKPFIAMWAMRYGADLKTPSASIQGPKVMLINETAGSGGDLLPWMFRKFGLGPLIGKRTWGGLVGVLGFPAQAQAAAISRPRPEVNNRKFICVASGCSVGRRARAREGHFFRRARWQG